ncbi:MAG: hypothetical protein J7L90_03910 [Dehalococcoidia bacterium]|nr:hypothetical protein [Dehalococcoidia bacterium]
MADIKSAFERAMERVEGLGEASDEEKARWKYVPEGESLAARYIAGKCDMEEELAKFEPSASRYVIPAVAEIFIRNINLPRNEMLKAGTVKAMEGIKFLRQDDADVDKVFEQVKYVLEHFENDGAQQKKEAYEALKSNFQARIEQAMRSQTGIVGEVNVDVEHQPEFQQEWRVTLAQLDSQYHKVLDGYKDELRTIFHREN